MEEPRAVTQEEIVARFVRNGLLCMPVEVSILPPLPVRLFLLVSQGQLAAPRHLSTRRFP